MSVLVLREREIRRLIGPEEARREVREAFVRLARGEVTLPGVIGMDLPAQGGEVHVKGAYLHGAPFYCIKEAAGFYTNPERGLPVGSGMMLVFDATTGFLRALLFDNGYLTELRTGAAGALAADLLARQAVRQVGVVGCGTQARYQLEALLGVRRPERALVYGRSAEKAGAYAREMESRFGIPVVPVETAREAVSGSDLVVTTTPAREPIVRADWVEAGTHITAVGSDGPDKQELEVEVLAKADKIVADRLDQCLRFGEIHHAVAARAIRAERIHGELGELAAGLKPGRTSEAEITVADLTGVGVQDAAVAGYAVQEAIRGGVGQVIEV